MRVPSAFVFSLLALALGLGCYEGPNVDVNRAPKSSTSSTDQSTDGTDPTDPSSSETLPPPSATPAAPGLPCDVQKLLADQCTSCHGTKLSSDAPNHLVTYADLAAPSQSSPSKTNAQLSLERMQATKRPMPPDGQLPSDQIAIFANWVNAGLPKGSCGTADAGK